MTRFASTTFALVALTLSACGSKAGPGPTSATSKPSPADGNNGEASTGTETMGTPASGTWKPGTGAALDRDGDGVVDDNDRCPDEPEDRDGTEDTDGCPDAAPPP